MSQTQINVVFAPCHHCRNQFLNPCKTLALYQSPYFSLSLSFSISHTGKAKATRIEELSWQANYDPFSNTISCSIFGSTPSYMSKLTLSSFAFYYHFFHLDSEKLDTLLLPCDVDPKHVL
jgi:hypothetical protein